MDRDLFVSGDLVVHFKRETLSKEELLKRPFKHIYRVVGRGFDTATEKPVMVYQPLDEDDKRAFFMFTRPIEEFYSEVDKRKYPNIKQKYRMELLQSNKSAPL